MTPVFTKSKKRRDTPSRNSNANTVEAPMACHAVRGGLPAPVLERCFSSLATFSTKESATDLYVALNLPTLDYV
jgi:hypothetical protein